MAALRLLHVDDPMMLVDIIGLPDQGSHLLAQRLAHRAICAPTLRPPTPADIAATPAAARPDAALWLLTPFASRALALAHSASQRVDVHDALYSLTCLAKSVSASLPPTAQPPNVLDILLAAGHALRDHRTSLEQSLPDGPGAVLPPIAERILARAELSCLFSALEHVQIATAHWVLPASILLALGFDPDRDSPGAFRRLYSSLQRSGALDIAFDAAQLRALHDPSAFAPDGWASTSLESTPILPPPTPGVAALCPAAALELLRGRCAHWRLVFATALLGADARAVETRRPLGTSHNYPTDPAEVRALEGLIAAEVRQGWLVRLPDSALPVARKPAPLNVVPKAPDAHGRPRWRMITDDTQARQPFFDGHSVRPAGVNASVASTELAYPGTPSLGRVAAMLLGPHPPTMLATLDVSSGFKRIRLAAASSTLFTVRFKGTTYISSACSMGGRHSSTYMNSCTAALAQALESPGVRLLSFCDDLLVSTDLPLHRATSELARIREAMVRLGLPPQAEKSSPPARSVEWVGLRLTTGNDRGPAHVRMKDGAVVDLVSALTAAANGDPDRDQLAKVVGRITWFSTLCKPIRPLLRDIRRALADSPDRTSALDPSAAAAARALLTWAPGIARPLPATFAARATMAPDPFPAMLVVTDASAHGFGIAVFDLRRTTNALVDGAPRRCVSVRLYCGRWHDVIPHSVRSEFACAAVAVAIAARRAPRSNIRLFSDSTTVVSAVARMSPSSRSTYSDSLAIPLALTLLRSHLVVHAEHLPGMQNTVTDTLSRLSASGKDAPSLGVRIAGYPLPLGHDDWAVAPLLCFWSGSSIQITAAFRFFASMARQHGAGLPFGRTAGASVTSTFLKASATRPQPLATSTLASYYHNVLRLADLMLSPIDSHATSRLVSLATKRIHRWGDPTRDSRGVFSRDDVLRAIRSPATDPAVAAAIAVCWDTLSRAGSLLTRPAPASTATPIPRANARVSVVNRHIHVQIDVFEKMSRTWERLHLTTDPDSPHYNPAHVGGAAAAAATLARPADRSSPLWLKRNRQPVSASDLVAALLAANPYLRQHRISPHSFRISAATWLLRHSSVTKDRIFGRDCAAKARQNTATRTSCGCCSTVAPAWTLPIPMA
ncbi:hypothetical protein FNF28_05557 [Cafeteria roenbergensis]|uniref:Reverse transcriptase domain-containing protein n=1 Tax=Cafeteria roenbergensis TaxID=33653 RepID=A0A5A8D5D0_CAFRO|nr:hypothetical protein FNF28_05557 [Cafeteria roenbergensis]